MKRKTLSSSQPPVLLPEKKQKLASSPIFDAPNRLKYIHDLGKGHFSTVREYAHPTEGNLAVKTMLCSRLEPLWVREAEILNLKHPNLLSMLDVMGEGVKGKEKIRLALPLAKESLFQALHQGKLEKLSLIQLIAIMYQMICGVHALHQLNILHGDLKPGNILITEWPQDNKTLPKIVLADPGLAVWIRNGNPEYPNGLFTFLYRPPEFFCRTSTDQTFYPSLKADVFALGVILREFLIRWLTGDFTFPPWLEWISQDPPKIDEMKSAQNFFRNYSNDSKEKWTQFCKTDWKEDTKERKVHSIFDLGKTQKRDLTKTEEETVKQLFQLTSRFLSFDPRNRPTSSEALTEINKIYSALSSSQFLSTIPLNCPSLTPTEAWDVMNRLPVLPSDLKSVDFKVKDPLIKKQLEEWYQWLQSNWGQGERYNEPIIKARKQSVLLELYRAAQALQTFKRNHPEFPDSKLPSLFYLYLVWINPSQDELLEKGLCQLGSVKRVDFTQFLFDILKNEKILAT